MSNKITTNTLSEIKEFIDNELIKRGFPILSKIEEIEGNYPFIKISSEPFNTTPVIMKSIMVTSHNGSIKVLDNGDIEFWIPVQVSYSHFNGGTNGTSLFNVSSTIENTNKTCQSVGQFLIH